MLCYSYVTCEEFFQNVTVIFDGVIFTQRSLALQFKFKFILFSPHIKQLTNTKNKFTLMKVNGDVDAIKERKACD